MTEKDLEIQELRRELEGMTKMQKMLAMFTEATNGVPLKRIRELAQADREGRCVVLPCKRGDTVWRICGPKGRKFVAERTVLSVTVYEPGKFEIFTNCEDWLGKTVFLTREEAEAALGAQKGAEDERD